MPPPPPPSKATAKAAGPAATPASEMTHWLPSPQRGSDDDAIECLCLGTGRFLRSVLVPACNAAGYRTALIQPRGHSFVDFMHEQAQQQASAGSVAASYPVDTVQYDGSIQTDGIACHGAFSLASKDGKVALAEVLPSMKPITILGLGVTEAGLASASTGAMKNLYELLHLMCTLRNERVWNTDEKLCVIDMDNVPNNGQKVHGHMMALLAEQEAEEEKTADGEEAGDSEIVRKFLTERVVFLNTMVDRITAHRVEPTNEPMIPRCEPTPAKALVILDPNNDLPRQFAQTMAKPENKKFGVAVRSIATDFQNDIDWKLRIANGTHTAIAHTMALCKLLKTDALSKSDETASLLCDYLDALFQDQIMPAGCLAAARSGIGSSSDGDGDSDANTKAAVQAVYDDWRRRLLHPHFGLSTFFITQNGPAKGGIRLGPTVSNLAAGGLASQAEHAGNSLQSITVPIAFAFAALLRWLTPCHAKADGAYIGWLDGHNHGEVRSAVGRRLDAPGPEPSQSEVVYADGLSHNLEMGWYEFRSSCKVHREDTQADANLSDWLMQLASESCGGKQSMQPSSYEAAAKAYLISDEGGNLGHLAAELGSGSNGRAVLDELAKAVSTLYARMIAGDPIMDLLREIKEAKEPYAGGFQTTVDALIDCRAGDANRPLHFKQPAIPNHSAVMKDTVDTSAIKAIVMSEVQTATAIDLHTHLLPPTHGILCLWGIDELLTYHYLVAEYFMVADASVTPENFFASTKQDQADMIWQALFLDRLPMSEACRGVVTVLTRLGLSDAVRTRDLSAIRLHYEKLQCQGEAGAKIFCEQIFAAAGVKYAIMTNIPFDALEAKYWKPHKVGYSTRFRSALRVDPLLAGDRPAIEAALKSSGYPETMDGARDYLREWCDVMEPEYMMASTPHDFVLREGSLATTGADGTRALTQSMNVSAMKRPFAFVDATNSGANCGVGCDGAQDEAPSVIDENSDFLSEVLMKVCAERDLPVALKIGARRGTNPKLKSAGDGVVAFADAAMLGRLCTRFPKVRFLATFLSRNNQHEACVLATKFRNLHIYGCWWFCNNPSIIEEITKMRVEMLGTSFTAQHSDARVVDQMLYKWPHSRAVLAKVLGAEYEKLLLSGWTMSRQEVRRDVRRIFGGSYEDFMSKSLRDQV